MWGMLGLRRHFVIEFQSHFWYVLGHRDVYVPLSVIPFDEQAAVIFSFPVDCHLELFFEGIEEMIGIGEGEIFYSKMSEVCEHNKFEYCIYELCTSRTDIFVCYCKLIN